MQWKAGTLQHQAQDAHATECQRRKLIEARSIKANHKAKQAPYLRRQHAAASLAAALVAAHGAGGHEAKGCSDGGATATPN